MFNCTECNKSYTYKYNLSLHIKYHDGIKFLLPYVLKNFPKNQILINIKKIFIVSIFIKNVL